MTSIFDQTGSARGPLRSCQTRQEWKNYDTPVSLCIVLDDLSVIVSEEKVSQHLDYLILNDKNEESSLSHTLSFLLLCRDNSIKSGRLRR